MSRYSGANPAVAGRWAVYVRTIKRLEAEERNAATPIERTARFRRHRARVQAALAEARALGGNP